MHFFAFFQTNESVLSLKRWKRKKDKLSAFIDNVPHVPPGRSWAWRTWRCQSSSPPRSGRSSSASSPWPQSCKSDPIPAENWVHWITITIKSYSQNTIKSILCLGHLFDKLSYFEKDLLDVVLIFWIAKCHSILQFVLLFFPTKFKEWNDLHF